MNLTHVWSWLQSAYWRVRFALEGFTFQPIAGATDVVELNVTTITELDSAIPELNSSKAPALVTV